MEQRILSVKLGREKVVSRPWDFEALCMVDDAKRADEAIGIRAGVGAVCYLFEGTEATTEELRQLPPSAMAALCIKVTKWYLADITEALKNA